MQAKDSGLRKGPLKPSGKGFTWPKEYFPANSVFYNLQILYQGVCMCLIVVHI